MITMPKTKSTLTTGKNAAISTKEAKVELAMLQKRQSYLQKVLGTAKPMHTNNPFIVSMHTSAREDDLYARRVKHRPSKAEKSLKKKGGWKDDWEDNDPDDDVDDEDDDDLSDDDHYDQWGDPEPR